MIHRDAKYGNNCPELSGGNAKTSTIMDVYRDHHARTANCWCSICWCAKQVIKQREYECEDTRPA